jgi:hypothetical protein
VSAATKKVSATVHLNNGDNQLAIVVGSAGLLVVEDCFFTGFVVVLMAGWIVVAAVEGTGVLAVVVVGVVFTGRVVAVTGRLVVVVVVGMVVVVVGVVVDGVVKAKDKKIVGSVTGKVTVVLRGVGGVTAEALVVVPTEKSELIWVLLNFFKKVTETFVRHGKIRHWHWKLYACPSGTNCLEKSEPVVVFSLIVEDRAVVDRMVGVTTVGEAAASVWISFHLSYSTPCTW